LLVQKFKTNLSTRFPMDRAEKILSLFDDPARLAQMPVNQFVGLFVAER
jgi:hypothetical protein